MTLVLKSDINKLYRLEVLVYLGNKEIDDESDVMVKIVNSKTNVVKESHWTTTQNLMKIIEDIKTAMNVNGVWCHDDRVG